VKFLMPVLSQNYFSKQVVQYSTISSSLFAQTPFTVLPRYDDVFIGKTPITLQQPSAVWFCNFNTDKLDMCGLE